MGHSDGDTSDYHLEVAISLKRKTVFVFKKDVIIAERWFRRQTFYFSPKVYDINYLFRKYRNVSRIQRDYRNEDMRFVL